MNPRIEYEYRITYAIEAAIVDTDEWEEIGFGSSGAWSSVDAAAYDVECQIQSRAWEVEGGMPDPRSIDGKDEP